MSHPCPGPVKLFLAFFIQSSEETNLFLLLKLCFVFAKGPVKSQEIKVVLTTLDILCPLPEIANMILILHRDVRIYPHEIHLVFCHS